ncbi:MAG: 50S ribosomal protein L15 [Acidimicrobiia bacterium]|nr:50S ribosomal protein L15 [Acidimicrobiia bacterium]
MKLHDLKPAAGARTRKRRVGRGEAGRRGKTAGRGTKGTGARNKLRPGFEGGQLPLARRVPKLRGFNRANKEYFALVNVGRLGEFPAKATVGPDELRAAGLIKKRGRVKVLGEGEMTKSITVRAHAFSLGAIEKIQAAGGTAEVIE